jgi:phytoene desaturase
LGSKKAIVIGSGFSSISAAAQLAKQGLEVVVLEKNEQAGGRARKMEVDGFSFDMGPSWYWMPEIFEQFYAKFGHTASDFYELKRLDPGYRVVFGKNEHLDIPADKESLFALFESIEVGSSRHLDHFLKDAAYNYNVAMNKVVQKPGFSLAELIMPETVKKAGAFVRNIRSQVRSKFKDHRLQQILEFPVLFLGAKPGDTPEFYNFMNHADLQLGTWYPMGGMNEIVQAMRSIAEDQGVTFKYSEEVESFITAAGSVKGVKTRTNEYEADVVVSGADYAHTESLLDQNQRQFSDRYWQKRTMAPSSLLFYLGVKGEISGLLHHNLFFDEDFDRHAEQIYDQPEWPDKPLFYACVSSKTDSQVAPEGHENVFLLIPIAPDLEDGEQMREKYFKMVMNRLEAFCGESIENRIVYKKSFCVSDFKKEYYSFKGNAYGMANTLFQTAYFRPGIRSKKMKNLYFTGQLTVPGPGVPPAIISGGIVSEVISKDLKL